MEQVIRRYNYVKKNESPLVIISNEDVSAASLLCFNRDKIEDSYRQDIVSNIIFESIITSIKNNFFNQRTMNTVNKIDLSDQKYQTNGIIIYKSYKVKFLFLMKNFV